MSRTRQAGARLGGRGSLRAPGLGSPGADRLRDAHQEQQRSVLDAVVDVLTGLVVPESTRETEADQAEPGA